jgi:hypothetical protein
LCRYLSNGKSNQKYVTDLKAGKHTRDFYLLSRSYFVNEIAQQRNILMPWQPSRRNGPRRLLQSDLLVISVNCALSIDDETSFALALHAAIRPKFPFLILDKRPKGGHAGLAVKPGDLKLWKHATSTGHNTSNVNQLIQVLVSNIADVAGGRALGQRFDAHENFIRNALTERWSGECAEVAVAR